MIRPRNYLSTGRGSDARAYRGSRSVPWPTKRDTQAPERRGSATTRIGSATGRQTRKKQRAKAEDFMPWHITRSRDQTLAAVFGRQCPGTRGPEDSPKWAAAPGAGAREGRQRVGRFYPGGEAGELASGPGWERPRARQSIGILRPSRGGPVRRLRRTELIHGQLCAVAPEIIYPVQRTPRCSPLRVGRESETEER